MATFLGPKNLRIFFFGNLCIAAIWHCVTHVPKLRTDILSPVYVEWNLKVCRRKAELKLTVKQMVDLSVPCYEVRRGTKFGGVYSKNKIKQTHNHPLKADIISIQLLLDVRQNTNCVCLKVPRFRPLVLLIRVVFRWRWVWRIGGMRKNWAIISVNVRGRHYITLNTNIKSSYKIQLVPQREHSALAL
jgi:hypothetical protein